MVDFVKSRAEIPKQGDESLEWIEHACLNELNPEAKEELTHKLDCKEAESKRATIHGFEDSEDESRAKRISSKTMKNFIQLFKNLKNLLDPDEDAVLSYNKIMDSLSDPGFFSLYPGGILKKTKLVLKSTFLVHFSAFFASCLFIEARNLPFFSICFLPEKCSCCDKMWGRFTYIFILMCVRFLVPIGTMFYCIFHLKELSTKTRLKILYIFSFYFVLFLILHFSNINDNLPMQQILAIGWLLHFILCLFFYHKLNIAFKQYLQKLYIPLGIGFSCYIYYILVTLAMPKLKDFLNNTYGKSVGEVLFSTIGSLLASFLLLIYELSMLKYNDFVQRENLNYQPAMFFCKYLMCITTTLRIAGILHVSPWSPGFFIAALGLLVFLIDFHLGYNIVTYNLKKCINWIIFKRKTVFEYPSTITSKLISFQHIDFMIVYIPRLSWFILRKRWLSPPFLKPHRALNCILDLSLEESETIRPSAFVAFALIDVFVTAGLLAYTRLKKIGLNKYFVEPENSFFRILIILSFHFFMETMLSVYD